MAPLGLPSLRPPTIISGGPSSSASTGFSTRVSSRQAQNQPSQVLYPAAALRLGGGAQHHGGPHQRSSTSAAATRTAGGQATRSASARGAASSALLVPSPEELLLQGGPGAPHDVAGLAAPDQVCGHATRCASAHPGGHISSGAPSAISASHAAGPDAPQAAAPRGADHDLRARFRRQPPPHPVSLLTAHAQEQLPPHLLRTSAPRTTPYGRKAAPRSSNSGATTAAPAQQQPQQQPAAGSGAAVHAHPVMDDVDGADYDSRANAAASSAAQQALEGERVGQGDPLVARCDEARQEPDLTAAHTGACGHQRTRADVKDPPRRVATRLCAKASACSDTWARLEPSYSLGGSRRVHVW